MIKEKIDQSENIPNSENLINKLINFVENIFSDDKSIYIKPLREKYINAINNREIDGLNKLAEYIENKLAYERKERYYDEGGARREELDILRQQLLSWIETLKKK